MEEQSGYRAAGSCGGESVPLTGVRSDASEPPPCLGEYPGAEAECEPGQSRRPAEDAETLVIMRDEGAAQASGSHSAWARCDCDCVRPCVCVCACVAEEREKPVITIVGHWASPAAVPDVTV